MIIRAARAEGRELSQQEVSTLSGYSLSSVSRALDQLIQMGAVYKQKDPRALRSYMYHINVGLKEMVASSLDTIIFNSSKSLEEVSSLTSKLHSINQRSRTEEGESIERILSSFGDSMKDLIGVLKRVKEEF